MTWSYVSERVLRKGPDPKYGIDNPLYGMRFAVADPSMTPDQVVDHLIAAGWIRMTFCWQPGGTKEFHGVWNGADSTSLPDGDAAVIYGPLFISDATASGDNQYLHPCADGAKPGPVPDRTPGSDKPWQPPQGLVPTPSGDADVLPQGPNGAFPLTTGNVYRLMAYVTGSATAAEVLGALGNLGFDNLQVWTSGGVGNPNLPPDWPSIPPFVAGPGESAAFAQGTWQGRWPLRADFVIDSARPVRIVAVWLHATRAVAVTPGSLDSGGGGRGGGAGGVAAVFMLGILALGVSRGRR